MTRCAQSACTSSLGLTVGVLALVLSCIGCGDNVADASREPPPGSGGRTSANGGTGGSAPVSCDVPLADRVRVTTITAPTEILANTEYYPVVLAPRDSGGSLVAWREAPSLTVRVAELDGNDQLAGTVLTLPGEEVHALLAHDDGGAVAIVEDDPDIFSDLYCNPETIPDVRYCGKLDLVRFDGSGAPEWRSTLTSKTNVNSDGALFIWRHEHTVRLGWSGQQYGVYFRSAGSVARPGVPGEVDIYGGDTFRFVSADGSSVDGGWSWGCTYSWSVRLAYGDHWGAACHGDGTPNALRLLIMDRDRTIGTALFHEGMDPTRRALGGLVPTDDGFWLSHIAEDADGVLQLHLADIDNSAVIGEDQVIAVAENIDDNYPYRAYMAEYAGDQLLIGWKSGGELQIAALDGSTGETLDGPVTVGDQIDQFQEFMSHPNGDVGWAWSSGGTDEVSVVRVRACE